MAKTTTVTTSYTSNIVVNGTTVSADKIYANGTQVRRCIVNGKDVIHKFTRTVDKIASDLTFTLTVRFTVEVTWLDHNASAKFSSPIYADVTVTDNGSSGFTSITLVNPLLIFYWSYKGPTDDNPYSYQQQLTNQSLPIGQTTTLTFSSFKGKSIPTSDTIPPAEYMGYKLSFNIRDPDEIETSTYMLGASYNSEKSYRDTNHISRTINKVLSDNTVQEY